MRYWLVLATGLWLAGCAAPPADRGPPPDREARQQQLDALDSWRVKGRVAIINGTEAWHLNVIWRQQDDEYHIELWGPFGSGRVQLEGDAQGVRLVDSHRRTYYARDPESLLYEHTGVKMPVSGLRYWILGLTDPQQDQQQPRRDERDRLASVQQGSWYVNFRRYTRLGQVVLPDRLWVDKDDLQVKLVVDDWQLP
ncbi:lipoprotein insertase outer membrane protein LolB [Thiohalophilus sp.]|uniref:lipoprotein insertase outer membrane protein LolB n=1 Tax=Thiohalophilus sp. TaxID=3028392 RepID=UPI002ACE3C9F|nr:lipoprotein insertase outer membrane protein LolB [Thiohalophilus sp.]MDZ7662060.1 lipoprotein insertase outer membrane protein LolB [Thiohalophilus sp.]